MNNLSPSPLADLHQLIGSQNPFDRSLVVRTHDVWEQSFPDVSSINGHISEAIYQGIGQIESGHRSVLGITIKAEKGLGKSHLISRLRHHLKEEIGSFFVYMSESDYSDLDYINSQFLNTLSTSLRKTGSQGVMQWQELATLLINQAYQKNYSPNEIIQRFLGVIARNSQLIDQLGYKICQLKPNIKDPYVLRAIFWTLSPEHSLFAINWLSGHELTQKQADVMGLPLFQEENRETRALSIASQILDLIGDYRTVIICFDEVEPKNSNAKGLTTPQVVSLLAKDLYSKIKRGILMMAIFPQTWSLQIKAMPQAESVMDRIGEKVFDLKYLNSDDVISLVSTWLEQFYRSHNLTPPTNIYPFKEKELRELGKERPIVRRVLKWCCENWKIGNPPIDPLHQVEIAFQEQLTALDSNLENYLDNDKLIADALFLGFQSLEGARVDQVLIDKVQKVDVKAVDRRYLDFRVVGNDKGKLVKIGVSVCQASVSKYVSATLKRLIEYQKFDFTRGCLVRSKVVKPNTQGYQYLQTLLSNLGGEWINLKGKDLQPLLAIWFVFKACDEYEITPQQVLEFIQQRKIAQSNYLIREILSDPSGQIPDNVIDEDEMIGLDNSLGQINESTDADQILSGLA